MDIASYLTENTAVLRCYYSVCWYKANLITWPHYIKYQVWCHQVPMGAGTRPHNLKGCWVDNFFSVSVCKSTSTQYNNLGSLVLCAQYWKRSALGLVLTITLAKGSKLEKSRIYQCAKSAVWICGRQSKFVHQPISKISLMTIDTLNMIRVEYDSGNAWTMMFSELWLHSWLQHKLRFSFSSATPP